MTRILGVETSCDETAIGVVEEGHRILSSVIASSQQFHQAYGGVVPEIAARVHVEVIWQVLEQALEQANCQVTELDAIAVTQGPGLPGALLIGLSFAKGLALALERPLIGVDHLAAHLYAGRMI
ncbi:MAG: tRNA (adenosine(37)-N6)-threonylcarbamoyltransferase complex transferase subunit TsaD, partial [Candidatus Omnitrophica bacterium]|nr:tRNA (adenosine(37)-N6)-threonylcarbamoyltransferase complex transferase subunit TsaD [Candidatus Omnitrophota bacterium]